MNTNCRFLLDVFRYVCRSAAEIVESSRNIRERNKAQTPSWSTVFNIVIVIISHYSRVDIWNLIEFVVAASPKVVLGYHRKTNKLATDRKHIRKRKFKPEVIRSEIGCWWWPRYQPAAERAKEEGRKASTKSNLFVACNHRKSHPPVRKLKRSKRDKRISHRKPYPVSLKCTFPPVGKINASVLV